MGLRRLPAARPVAVTAAHTGGHRARDLVACLVETEARIAATLHRLATDAAVEGRAQRAHVYRAVAERAHRDAEQARRTGLAVPTASVLDPRLR